MKESHRAYKPGDVLVDDEWGEEDQAWDVVDEEGFLTDGVTAVDVVLHVDVEYVKYDCESEAHSGEVVCP